MTIARELADIIQSNGDVVISGGLEVNGTTTTINTTTFVVEDKNIELGGNATSNSQNDGAGISILLPDASPDEFATLTYVNSSDAWSFNKGVEIAGSITSSGTLVSTINGNNSSGGNLFLGATGNNSPKFGSVALRQYNSGTETEGYSLITGAASDGSNAVWIGGGFDEQNAATAVYIKSAADSNTRNGTNIAQFNLTGLNLLTGTFQVGGTTVIDSSRNITGASFVNSAVRYIANQIQSGYADNSDNSDIWINYTGYQGGTTYFRDFRVGNGKQAQLFFVDGSSGNVDVTAGDLQIGGTTVIDSGRNVTNIGTISSGAINVSSGTSQPLSLTTSSGSPWHIGLTRSDIGLTSRVFAHNSPYNSWYFEHNISVAGNANWYAGNDGSGSGLDADLLDGYHASTTRNEAGTIPIRDGNGYLQLGWINTTSGSAGTTAPDRIYGSYDGYIRYYTPANLKTVLGYLTTADEGSGNGIDADTLDGQHASAFLTGNQTISLSGATTGSGTTSISTTTSYVNSVTLSTNGPDSSLEYQQASGISDTKLAPSTDWHNTIRMGHGDPYSYYGNTIAVRMTGTGLGDLYTQCISNNTATGWNKHYHTNNDGSGSGLDADLLDGLDATTAATANTIVARDSGVISLETIFLAVTSILV